MLNILTRFKNESLQHVSKFVPFLAHANQHSSNFILPYIVLSSEEQTSEPVLIALAPSIHQYPKIK